MINEVNCEGTDWIELANTGATAEEIGGWRLSDDPLDASGADPYVLGAGTTIPAAGRISFQRDEEGPDGFPFGISCGDTIRLADTTPTLVDEVSLPDLDFEANGTTWGRLPDTTGDFAETAPTRDAANAPPVPPEPADPSWLFDPTKVFEIDLTLPPESYEAMSNETTWDQDHPYHDGTFKLTAADGTEYEYEVGIRLKGGRGSFEPLTNKAAFKVRFHHSVPGQRFSGISNMTLNNMVGDPTMVHELLAYKVFRARSVPAPRTGYAYVRVNGSDYGVYANIETMNDIALARWYGSTQHLYEGEYGVDVASGQAPLYEVDEGPEDDRSDLEALIAAVEGPTPADFSDRVASVADLEEMTRMWSVEKYVGHKDGYAAGLFGLKHPNNYYLHSDASGLFTMLPWGTDSTWVAELSFDGRGRSVLVNRCFDDADCFALFRQGVATTRSTVAGLDLDSIATETADMLAPWRAMDPRKPYDDDETAFEFEKLRKFIAARPGEAADWLADTAPPRPPTTTPTGSVAGAEKRKRAKWKCKKKRKRPATAEDAAKKKRKKCKRKKGRRGR